MAFYDRSDELKPLTLTKREAYRYIGIPSLVQDWLFASRHSGPKEKKWVEIVVEGGRGRATRIDRESLDRAYSLYKKGFRPPPIPSRKKG